MAKYHGYGIRVVGDDRGDAEYPGGRTLREARREMSKFIGYRTDGHMRSSADIRLLGYDRKGRAYVVDVSEGHVDRPNHSGPVLGSQRHSWIITNGKRRNTKNQAALRAKINKQLVEMVSIGEVNNFPTADAVMDVFFSNGDQASMTWADRGVLAEKLLTWRGLYGVPLEWNGASRGVISSTNSFLQSQIHPSRR